MKDIEINGKIYLFLLRKDLKNDLKSKLFLKDTEIECNS